MIHKQTSCFKYCQNYYSPKNTNRKMRRNLTKPIVGGNEMFMWVLVYQL